MVSYTLLNVGDPLAFVFGPQGADLPWVAGIIAVSAVIALATVFLVFQIGQPRIWMAMSRDGLLPRVFSSIHPKFKTPWFATLVTGAVVAVPALFMNLTEVTDLTSIGTLFAFVLVCGGVLLLPKETKEMKHRKRFRMPYINGKYIVPAILITITLVFKDFLIQQFDFSANWHEFREKIPFYIFVPLALSIAVLTFIKNLSLIPVLGLLSCSYLMTELGYINW